MEERELLDLFRAQESDRVERKSALSDKSEIEKAICAFANDLPDHRQPGCVFVGVRDNGACASLAITDELLRELGSIRSSGNIMPLPSMDVSRKTLDGCTVAVVTVHPAIAPPVRLRGVCWVRVGPQKAIATPADETRLTEKRRWRDVPFDLHPLPMATIDDLDLRFFEEDYLRQSVDAETLERNQRTRLQQLQALRFVSVEDPVRPTVSGMLAIGRSPDSHVPGAYVEFLRIAGRELADPVIDNKRVSGNLLHQARTLDDLCRLHIGFRVSLAGDTEVRMADYPLVALQQLIRNAIMHRQYEGTAAPIRIYWFEDRIEIHNPGGPYGQVTKDNFGKPGFTDYRNPHVAEVMKTLGLVQRFGVGIATARAELEKSGNPGLEFEVDERHVVARIRRTP